MPSRELDQRGFVFLADDVHAQFDALVADEHRRTGDELAHLVLALCRKTSIQVFFESLRQLCSFRSP